MNGEDNRSEQSHLVIVKALQTALVSVKKLYKISRRIQNDFETDNLKRIDVRLSQRRNIFDHLQALMKTVNYWQYPVDGCKRPEINRLANEIKYWLKKFAGVDNSIMKEAEKNKSILTENLRRLHQSRNVVVSYGKNSYLNKKAINNGQQRTIL